MLYCININTLTGSISALEKNLRFIAYTTAPSKKSTVSNVGIESIGSAGQAGFTYQALV